MYADDCLKTVSDTHWCGDTVDCDNTLPLQNLPGCRPFAIFGTSAFLDQDLPWFPHMSDALLLVVVLILLLFSVMAALR